MPDTGLRLVRHADHDPDLICRPALGSSVLCEVPGLREVPEPPPVPDGQGSLSDDMEAV